MEENKVENNEEVEEVVEEVVEETAKDTTEDWEAFVRSEVNAALDMFMPYSIDGNMGISYKRAVKEKTDQGVSYHVNKVDGVTVVIDFNFAEPVDKIVEQIEETEE